VAEYFDAGYSRSRPWHHRPQAAQLLRAASRPDHGFEAVVIGEYERAFVLLSELISYRRSAGARSIATGKAVSRQVLRSPE
jgi:hypothetical protein